MSRRTMTPIPRNMAPRSFLDLKIGEIERLIAGAYRAARVAGVAKPPVRALSQRLRELKSQRGRLGIEQRFPKPEAER